MKQLPAKGGTELIIYQIGELKNLVENMALKQDNFQQKIDQRVSALELWKAGEEERGKNAPLDIQKILLAAFGLIAAALAIIQSGILK